MNIRRVKLEDLADLNQLYMVLCEEAGNLKVMQHTFKLIESNPDYYLLGVECDGKIVGTLMGIVCHDLAGKYKAFMTVENVIVDEAYRGKGIGKALFDYIEQVAFERACRYIYLVSGNNRQGAHRMYEKLGYHCDTVKGFKKYLEVPYA